MRLEFLLAGIDHNAGYAYIILLFWSIRILKFWTDPNSNFMCKTCDWHKMVLTEVCYWHKYASHKHTTVPNTCYCHIQPQEFFRLNAWVEYLGRWYNWDLNQHRSFDNVFHWPCNDNYIQATITHFIETIWLYFVILEVVVMLFIYLFIYLNSKCVIVQQYYAKIE